MAKYKYTAIDQNGKEKKGKVDANSDEEASAQISGMGLMVTELTKIGGGKPARGKSGGAAAPKKKGFSLSFGKAVNTEGLTTFTRQLATLLQAGLPLLRGLEIMERQEKNPKFKAVLGDLAITVKSGSNLSDGLSQYPRIFDNLFINMVKAGEAGGVLDVVLSRLATFMEKALKTKKKVQSAMTYPIVVLVFAFGIVALLMAFVVPKFQQIFKDMLGADAQLPPLTQMVVGISDFVKNQAPIAVVLVVLLVVGIKMILRTKAGTKFFDIMVLKIPKFGELGTKAAVARFTRTFGTLLSSGVPILQALTITRDIIGNSVIMEALDKVHDRVRDGEPLSGPLEQTKVFPTMVTSMIDVGEETGELAEMLNRIADNYDEDLDNAVSSITSLIEPLMIIFLALVVGTIVIALFMPIIQIVSNMAT